ncbi:TPA: hypothetical protein N0F65_005663 [Lagenidium giganteum]|uniref:Uncharacterized protein n=1 Tax=Lagenidium giganteum TaxID=4803 RepID=A0AAV2ZA13_9STRA|nr:TPA: hypothetical protein N0F65_005663 [Lagenidium giganteum]
MRTAHNHNRADQVLEVGDKVMLSTKHLLPEHTGLPASSKLCLKWIGQYAFAR